MTAIEKQFISLIGYPLVHDDIDGCWVDQNAINTLSDVSESMVNCFSIHADELAKEIVARPMERSNMLQLFFSWVETFSTLSGGSVDPRNEAQVKTCILLKGLSEYESARSFFCGSDEETAAMDMFCEKAIRWHKTLQQSFAKVLFVFANECPALADIKKQMNQGWYRMPLV